MMRPIGGVCPNCGNMVTIRGNYWKCGGCGRFGRTSTPVTTPATLQVTHTEVTLTLSVSVTHKIDLQTPWNELKNALNALLPEYCTQLSVDLGKVALYEIAQGMGQAEAPPEDQKIQVLTHFLQETPDLGVTVTLQDLQANPDIFRDTAALSEQTCGSFWTVLLRNLPQDAFHKVKESDAFYNFFADLGNLYGCFSGAGQGTELEQQMLHADELKRAFKLHWGRHMICNPDGERAKQLLSRGKIPADVDICREILIAGYPQLLDIYDIESLATDSHACTWEKIVEEAMEKDTDFGITMWRTLLDSAEPSLRKKEDIASMLLPNWIKRKWLYEEDKNHLLPFLHALKEERFACQVFQSAYVYSLQLDILRACNHMGEITLGNKLLSLQKSSPFPQEKWKMPLEMYERGLRAGLVRKNYRKGKQ